MASDFVVVGGGVVGASVAYHLARRGASVTVLERGCVLGEGSTGKAAGGFRAQFGSESHIRLSILSREKLLRFRDEIGVDPGYEPSGYLLCAASPERMAALQAAHEVQRAAGLADSRLVTPEEMSALYPTLRTEDLLGGSYCPTDGCITPLAILYGYNAAARRLGVEFRTGETVIRIEVEDGIARGVETNLDYYPCGAVVAAAGAWSAQIVRLAGISSYPVRPVKRNVAVTTAQNALPDGLPWLLDCDSRVALRRREGRVLVLRAGPRDPEGFDTRFDPAFLAAALPAARARVAALESAAVDPRACYAGLYEETPDGHGIAGWAASNPAWQVEGLLLVNGFSGHGVMHAPAVGEIAAAMAAGEAAPAWTSDLSPGRFAPGRAETAPQREPSAF